MNMNKSRPRQKEGKRGKKGAEQRCGSHVGDVTSLPYNPYFSHISSSKQPLYDLLSSLATPPTSYNPHNPVISNPLSEYVLAREIMRRHGFSPGGGGGGGGCQKLLYRLILSHMKIPEAEYIDDAFKQLTSAKHAVV